MFKNIKPPVDISTFGHYIDSLFNYITVMNIIYLVLVCIGIFGFSFLYSRKRNPTPTYTHGNKKKQIWTVTLLASSVFFAIDMYITSKSNNDMINVFWNFPDYKKENVLRVQILAQQWMWNIRYAGKDGVFNTADDIVTNNDLRIPTNTKVYAQITSKDVIHAFYLPNYRIKADAMPGRISRLWFETRDGITGEYDIACAEMCGTHHYLMKAKLTVYTKEEFDRWMSQSQQYAFSGNDTENPDTFWGWKWESK